MNSECCSRVYVLFIGLQCINLSGGMIHNTILLVLDGPEEVSVRTANGFT